MFLLFQEKVKACHLKISLISKSMVTFFKSIAKVLVTLSYSDPLGKQSFRVIRHLGGGLKGLSLQRKELPQLPCNLKRKHLSFPEIQQRSTGPC